MFNNAKKKLVKGFCIILLLLVGCSKEANVDNSEIEELNIDNQKVKNELYFYDIARDCVKYFYNNVEGYKQEFDVEIFEENEMFILWSIVEGDIDNRATSEKCVITYKEDDEGEVYYGNNLIWKNNSPLVDTLKGLEYEPRCGAQVISGSINIRENHSIDSKKIGLANTEDDYYLVFETYYDGIYTWYRIYVPSINSFGWMADLNGEWVNLCK